MAFKARLTMGSKAEERLEEMMKTSATKFQSGLNKKESFWQKAIKYLILKISYIGYEDKILNCTVNEDLGKIYLTEIVQYLEDVTVYAQMVNNQQVPIVSSTVKAIEIEEKLGAGEFPTILKNSFS